MSIILLYPGSHTITHGRWRSWLKVQTKLSLLGYHLKLFLFECHNGMMFLLNDIGKKLSACLVPVFESTENSILEFSKNCSCYSNLVFSVFFITRKTEPNVFYVFYVLFVFQNKKKFFKHRKQTDPKFPSSRYFGRYWGNNLTCWAVGLRRREINVFVDQEESPHR